MTDVKEIRVRKDGSIRLPVALMDSLKLYPGTKIEAHARGGDLVIRKVAAAEDPFAAAAKGPDLDAMDKIQEQQRRQTERARSHFEEMLKKPPKILPEDNPDLWR